ncbi:NAD-dependent epimerase/dehydratase family protein [Streptomyces himalayensis]|uniref:NAD-dependent epimerase/dehydratase family protein n=1 Tax=Streptomyces himalayensis subsp. himalayensis TaxID=2756131 RepID=A0A7W0DJT0_9ACTN|nr:NAD-dependent epimerase/dehydratase family protein [Streptomyces himalayensis]MBA2945669.1 NAD-dependent epimerase/dehydratase family protein [Streptomyces himalayensis subsp. himalayensis]
MSSTSGKRIVVTGATGNLGTSLLQSLAEDETIDSVLGLARRVPDWTPPKTEWASADVAKEETDLTQHFRGADAVVHLAWQFQPARDPAATWRTNVLGSVRVFQAVAATGVPVLVHASSVGAYSPKAKDGAVDESWPTHGWPEAAYCREKAYLERTLDAFEPENPAIRVVRLRPAFMFKQESASEQRRLFAGRFMPGQLARPELLPVVPDIPGLRFQALHTEDAARACRLTLSRTVQGAFNLAAEPPIDALALGELFHARVVRVPTRAARSALAAAWGLHLVPASPQLFDAVIRLPLMDCSRARDELDWRPQHTAIEALEELLRGMRRGAGMPTPPLAGSKAA